MLPQRAREWEGEGPEAEGSTGKGPEVEISFETKSGSDVGLEHKDERQR